MADLEKELSRILSDKDSAQKLQKMAESLFTSGVLSDDEEQKTDGSAADLPFDIGKVSLLFRSLKEVGDDHAVQLIKALIPYLENERKERANKVIKIMRLWSAVPLLKESGILDDRF